MKNKSKILLFLFLPCLAALSLTNNNAQMCKATDTLPEYDAENYEVSENETIKFDFNDDNYDFEEDFWVRNGKWEIEDGCLHQKRDFANWNDYQMNYNKKVFGDFTAVMRFKVNRITNTNDGWFGFFFRRTNLWHQHEESGFIATTGTMDQGGKCTLTEWASKKLAYDDYAVFKDTSDFITLAFVAKGNVFTAYYNDEIETGEYSYRITDDQWNEPGFIGFGAGNTLVSLDYLYIYTGTNQDGIVKEVDQEENKVDHLTLDSIIISEKSSLPIISYVVGAVGVVVAIISFVLGGKKHE